MDEKITDLEIRITHQEHHIEELDKVIVEQHKLIDRLNERLLFLEKRLKTVTEDHIKRPEEETPPPHY